MFEQFRKDSRPDGYLESIRKGSAGAYRFRGGAYYGSGDREAELARLKNELETADAVVIGAGSGLSTSAGYTYTGERLNKWFGDFVRAYNIPDMYSGGFIAMQLPPEIMWAYWARYIYINRYIDPPKPVYNKLYDLVKDKDYFVITTNVDHCFQKSGFDKNRLFYTQGDYGLFQTVDGRNGMTCDNEEWVMKAMEAQGFVRDVDGVFQIPEDGNVSMRIPTELIPKTPDGKDVTTNLRADDRFVQDEGWYEASANYARFLKEHEKGHVLYLELGVGANTPVIIKFPFWTMVSENPDAVYACLNYNEAYAPKQIADRSIIIDGDTGDVLKALKK